MLLGYPTAAVFLYEEIDPSGITRYNVVDGKQRLTTILEFVKGRFPVAEDSKIEHLRGKYFEHPPRTLRRKCQATPRDSCGLRGGFRAGPAPRINGPARISAPGDGEHSRLVAVDDGRTDD